MNTGLNIADTVSWNYTRLRYICQQLHYHSPHTHWACHPGSRKLAKIESSAVYINHVQRANVDWPRQSCASGQTYSGLATSIPRHWYSAAFLVNPQLALRDSNGVASKSFTTDSTSVLPRVLEEIKADAWDQELCLFKRYKFFKKKVQILQKKTGKHYIYNFCIFQFSSGRKKLTTDLIFWKKTFMMKNSMWGIFEVKNWNQNC